MLFAIIAAYIILLVPCFLFISWMFRKEFTGIGKVSFSWLQGEWMMERIWPGDVGFWSLKFSAARHCFVGIVFSLLIYLVNIQMLNKVLLSLNTLYFVTACIRYSARCKNYKRRNESAQSILKPVKRACLAALLYSSAAWLFLFVIYGVRPY